MKTIRLRWVGLTLSSAVLLSVAQSHAEAPDQGASKDRAAGESADDEGIVELDEKDQPAAEVPASEVKPEAAPTAEAGQPPTLEPDTQSEGMARYRRAMAAKKLEASIPLSRDRLREELGKIEAKVVDGRQDEAIGDLVYLVESSRFRAFKDSEEGRTARYLLGDSLGRMGAEVLARGYLVPLLSGDPNDTWARRAARSLVDLGLNSDRPEIFVKDLSVVARTGPEEVRGDIAYLTGRMHESKGRKSEALAAFATVTPKSRFWAQATYFSGLVEVERGNLKKGENHFCKVADPKQTPREAPVYGGSDFFRVRDLARLGLGRVAHEQYRFDDAQYYYYLVPRDSEHLPEALYETATTRYEAKDYDGAREYMDELKSLGVHHPYEDEAWLMDAYIDLATCHFPSADAKLSEFLKRYEPVRNAARQLAKDDAAVKKLVESVRTGSDPAAAGLGVEKDTARALGALLRVDSRYGRATLRLARLDHQRRGLLMAMGDLDEAQRRLAKPDEVRPQAKEGLGQSSLDKMQRIEAQLAEVKRLIRDIKKSGRAKGSQLAELEAMAETLTASAKAARLALRAIEGKGGKEGEDLSGVIAADRARASELYEGSNRVRSEAEKEQLALAKDALVRLDRRLSRLVRRARLGRIETVLGKKRALEIEIEALSQGLLPQTIVDSLDAARYLQDDEEYWPFEGEDWEDEYVGGEGLR